MWRKKNTTQIRHERITMFYSLVTLFAFLQHINALDAPVDLQAVEVSTHSFSVLWRTTDTKAKFFEANISPLNDGETAEANKFLNETFTTWIDLVPGKDYDVSVYSVSEEGIMSEATKITVTTHPMPVYALRLSRFANPILTEYRQQGDKTMMYPIYGAVVSWQGPDSGRFDNFEVDISPPDGKVRLPLAIQGGRRVEQPLQKRRIAWDLTPGVYYDFGARTMSGNAVSETATAGLRMTPEIPSEIQVDKISPTEATLSWDQPHRGILDGFVVEMTPFETSRVIEPQNSTDKRRIIADLTPGSIYDVDVFSTSFGVLSMKPRKKRIITPPATPLRPVLSRDVTTNSLLVSWQRPPGRLDFYELVYWPTKRDVSRLRHRTSTEQVRLTGLQPSTQYSLLIFSVSNEIHSEPLKAFVWTGNLTTTTPPPVLTTVLSKITQHTEGSTTLKTESVSVVIKGSTAKDEGDKTKDRERALRNNTEATNGDATSKPSTIIDGITQEMSTIPLSTTIPGRPNTLPPHHSIPYTEPTIEPFPTTVYFSGRVTTSPPSQNAISSTTNESPKLKEVEIVTTTATATATSTLHKLDNLVDTETSPTGSASQAQTDLTSSSTPAETRSGSANSATTKHMMASSTSSIGTKIASESVSKPTSISITEATPTTHSWSKLPSSGPHMSSKATSIASHKTPIQATISSHTTDTATLPDVIATEVTMTPGRDKATILTLKTNLITSTTESPEVIETKTTTPTFDITEGLKETTADFEPSTDKSNTATNNVNDLSTANQKKTSAATIESFTDMAVTVPKSDPSVTSTYAPGKTDSSTERMGQVISTTEHETKNTDISISTTMANDQTTNIETTEQTNTQSMLETTLPEDVKVTTDHKIFEFTPNGQVISTTGHETKNTVISISTTMEYDQTTNIETTEETNTQSMLETTLPEDVKVTTDHKIFEFTPNGQVISTTGHETKNTDISISTTMEYDQTTNIETTEETNTQSMLETTLPENVKVTTDHKIFEFTPNGQVISTTGHETKNTDILISTTMEYDQTTNIETTEETNTQSMLETTLPEDIKATTDHKMFEFTPINQATTSTGLEITSLDVSNAATVPIVKATSQIVTSKTETQQQTTAAKLITLIQRSTAKATPPSHLTPTKTQPGKKNESSTFPTTHARQDTTNLGDSSTKVADPSSVVATTDDQISKTVFLNSSPSSTSELSPSSSTSTYMSLTPDAGSVEEPGPDPFTTPETTKYIASSFVPSITKVIQKSTTLDDSPQPRGSNTTDDAGAMTTSFAEDSTTAMEQTTTNSVSTGKTSTENIRETTGQTTVTDGTGSTSTVGAATSLPVQELKSTTQRPRSTQNSQTSSVGNVKTTLPKTTSESISSGQASTRQTLDTTQPDDVIVTTDHKIIEFMPTGQTTATYGAGSTSTAPVTVSSTAQELKSTSKHTISTQSPSSQSQVSTTEAVVVASQTSSVGNVKTTLPKITSESISSGQASTRQTLDTTQPDDVIVTTDHKIIEFMPTGQTTVTSDTGSTSTVAVATSFPVQELKSTTQHPTSAQSMSSTEAAEVTSPIFSIGNVTTALPKTTTDSTSSDQASHGQSLDTTQPDDITVTTDHKIIEFLPTGETTFTAGQTSTVVATSQVEELVSPTVQSESTTNMFSEEGVSTTLLSPSSPSVSPASPFDETTLTSTLSSVTTQQDTSNNASEPAISTDSELTTKTNTNNVISSVAPFPDESPTSGSSTEFSKTPSKAVSTTDSTETLLVANATDDTVTITPVANSSTTKPKPRDQPDPKTPDGISELETTASNGTPTALQTTTPNPGNGSTTNGGTTISVTNATAKNVPITKGFQTICKPNNITILVDKNVIGQYEELYGPLHLNDYDDPKCKGVEHEKYYRYTIAPDISQCGTEFEINETHVNFTNVVSNSQRRAQWLKQITDSNGQVILGSRLAKVPMVFVHMNIWCTFPRTINVSTPFLPDIQIHMLTFNVSGHGEFSALMQLYRSEAFERPYLRPPMLSMDDTLHVGVSLLETKDPLTFLVVRRCWATPERDPAHPQRYDIIKDSCPVQDSLDGTVEILENGLSKRARWQGSVFKFVRFDRAWIHCEIKVCFGAGCEENCTEGTSRVKRDERSKHANVVTFGPVSLNHTVVTAKPIENNTTAASGTFLNDTKVLILVVALSVVIVFCCVVIMCVLARLRRQKNRNKQSVAGAGTTPSAPFPTSPVQSRSSSDRLEESFKHVRNNSAMSTFGSVSSSKSTSPLSMSPGAMAISGGRFGYDNTNFFSSTTELRDAEAAADDFPAPPPEVLSGSHCALNIPPAADCVAIEGIDGQYRKFS